MRKIIFLFSLWSWILAAQPTQLLIIIHSENGNTYKMAQILKTGAEQVPGVTVAIKTINHKKKNTDGLSLARPNQLSQYQGIAFGCPIYFSSISGEMKQFLDQTLPLWKEQSLSGKPATVFLSGGSGSGRETAIIALWSSLASHGMTLVTTGTAGMQGEQIDGLTNLGTTSLTTNREASPSEIEKNALLLQGKKWAQTAQLLSKISMNEAPIPTAPVQSTVRAKLAEKKIILPPVPQAVGSYEIYKISGKLLYINQIALKEDKKVLHPGKLGEKVSKEQAQEATRQTLLNVLAIAEKAVGLDNITQVIQLTGYFNTDEDFQEHANILNTASELLVDVFGDAGKHTRAAVGAASLPLNSVVELQAIFEIK